MTQAPAPSPASGPVSGPATGAATAPALAPAPADWTEPPASARPRIRYWVPAAAMDEADLRTELRALRDRGLGGIELVVLPSPTGELERSDHGWGTPAWDRLVDAAADECAALGLSLDLAAGPGWPLASPALTSVDDPGALTELTWGELALEPGVYEGPLPERRVTHDEGTPVLVHVAAYPEVAEGVLDRAGYRDLTEAVVLGDVPGTGTLRVELPELPELPTEGSSAGRSSRCWRLLAFWRQPSAHRINGGRTIVVDHHSAAGVDALAAYWGPLLEAHPMEALESFFCDSLEYRAAIDWTEDLPEEFERRRGYSILPYLPAVGFGNPFLGGDPATFRFAPPDEDLAELVNNDYAETLTDLYCERHLDGLTALAERRGLTVRYQVAYNKPMVVERSALHVSVPENEALGRATLDGQRLMAAAAHLGRKERYSFECAAEFGPAYGQDHEDLLWWVKRSLMAGMNAQVLHGGSYSGALTGPLAAHPELVGAAWPGYEGFGKFVSNYWNRTLSVADSRGVMTAIARLNTVFRRRARVDVAVLHTSPTCDGTGSDGWAYGDDGALARRGYSYEFLAPDMLGHENLAVRDGVADPDGVGYRALVIPPHERLAGEALERIGALAGAGLPVVWVGERPVGPLGLLEHDGDAASRWQARLEAAWVADGVVHVASTAEVPAALEESAGVLPRAALRVVAGGTAGDGDLLTAVREDEGGERYVALYAPNRVIYAPDEEHGEEIVVSAIYRRGTTKSTYARPGAPSRREVEVTIEGAGAVSLCDPWSGTERPAAFIDDGAGHVRGTVLIEEDEMLVLRLHDADGGAAAPCAPAARVLEEVDGAAISWERLRLRSFEPDEPGELSFLRSHLIAEERVIKLSGRLRPWRELEPGLERFAGQGVYEGRLVLPEGTVVHARERGARLVLALGRVCDTVSVRVDGVTAPFPDQVMKRVDLTELLHDGVNELELTVTSNLYNRLQEPGVEIMGEAVPYVPRDYGVWEEPGHPLALLAQIA